MGLSRGFWPQAFPFWEDFMKQRTLIFVFVTFLAILASAPQASLAQTPIPSPVLTFLGTNDYIGSDGNTYTSYNLSVSNWQLFPAYLFELRPDLPACGSNTNASRTWVDIYVGSGRTFTRIYGFCALEHPQDLTTIWFALPQGQDPPAEVYITLWDRLTNTTWTSNTLPIPDASPDGYPPVSLPLDKDGGTNVYEFANNLFNYKVTYPAFSPPTDPVYLVVQPILISQTDLDALADGTAFEGVQLVPYGGLEGFGVLFRVTCENSADSPVPCPASGGTYEVRTSWEPTGQVIVAPAFLKAPEGTNIWENIFTNYYEDRIDPTGSGRACCRYSDFVFVDGGSAMAGASPPTIRIITPQNGATYAVNESVAANYVCSGSQVKSCLGPVLSGRPIDTSSPGTKTFEVNATVTSGPTAVQVVTYYVRGFDLRLLYNPSISIKSGWPILIMLELRDANGKNVSSSKIRLKAVRIVPADSDAGGTPQPWGFAKSCKDFLYIPWPAKGWYVFLLDTRGLGAGSYLLQFTVSADSGSTYSAPFKIK
jgi:hypothetical protein